MTPELVIIGILTSGIRLATPYLYAAIGETFGQRSGVLNLGVDGQMLLGAFAAFYVAFTTGNLGLGLLAAVAVGALMGLAMAFITVNLQAEQGISGIGFYLFGLGMSELLFKMLLGTVETVKGFPSFHIPLLGDIPVIGEIFFQQNAMVYGAFLLVPVAWFVLNKTTLGLKIRSVGENPEAVGAWRPWGVLAGALLFSMVNSLQLWMQVLNIPIPSEIAVMLPYILTIVVLVATVSKVRSPSALTKPFDRGD
ncbi:MAG: hypothetical protein B6243_07310 [Anaerolineaceae bacterium 4572_5.2]|nr:MAG: hypothetical protein B6243_07310 [Anaerolineaceae bacterium 4572_5.2]